MFLDLMEQRVALWICVRDRTLHIQNSVIILTEKEQNTP